jgi:alpha-1,6-mannosyltransferase
MVGTAALGGLVGASLLLAAGAAARRSPLVPGPARDYPGWVAGPLRSLGVGPGTAAWEVELGVVFGSYLLVMACLAGLGPRRVWGAIVAAHVVFVLAPPLFSADVFGYLDFARLGALHGLDPYTHTSLAARHDPVYPFVGWHRVHSPYGPLFTVLTYALVPLGVSAGLWTLKVLAGAFSLATVALVWSAAPAAGSRRLAAVVLLGLNPVLLVFAVGGAHNDALLILLSVAALAAVLIRRPATSGVAALAAVGIKASAGLLFPFLLIGAQRRRRMALGSLLAAAALVALAIVAFGPHAAGFASALRGQQGLVAVHSIPAQAARLFGSPRLEAGVRTGFIVVLAVIVGWQLWRASRTREWITAAGWSTLALLATTAWLLPWYAVWLLPLAALREDRSLRAAAVAFSAYAILTRMPFAAPALTAVT